MIRSGSSRSCAPISPSEIARSPASELSWAEVKGRGRVRARGRVIKG